jgi:hypothetical protein
MTAWSYHSINLALVNIIDPNGGLASYFEFSIIKPTQNDIE